ncbi:MAG: hypothetical protein WCD89_19395 [Anaerocolumna sp.]
MSWLLGTWTKKDAGQDEFSACKAEEGCIAVATAVAALIDNNAADGNSGKPWAKMSRGHCTRS